MDLVFIIRIGFALVVAVILARQARGMVAQPHRRRAFWLAALGLLLFTAFNLTLAYNQPLGMIQNALAIGGFVLFVASFVSLFISFRSGCLLYTSWHFHSIGVRHGISHTR